jgi:hypothetical protein
LHFGLHIHLHDQYSIPLIFQHCEKLALFDNLDFTQVDINFEKNVIHLTNFMSNMFIRVEGGVKFTKHLKRGVSL